MSETKPFLSVSERSKLERYLAQADSEAAYGQRARLLILYDDGMAPELAANQVGVAIHRARHFIRAFNRRRLALFPPSLFSGSEDKSASQA